MADGKVLPVLESMINHRLVDWGLPVVHETLCKFCENLLLNKELIDPFVDFRPTSVKLLKLFCYHPDLHEASSWGSLELECNTLETKWNLLAEPYSFKEIIQCFIRGRIFRSYWSWEEGSLMLTSKPKKMVLKYSVKAGSLARKLLGKPPW